MWVSSRRAGQDSRSLAHCLRSHLRIRASNFALFYALCERLKAEKLIKRSALATPRCWAQRVQWCHCHCLGGVLGWGGGSAFWATLGRSISQVIADDRPNVRRTSRRGAPRRPHAPHGRPRPTTSRWRRPPPPRRPPSWGQSICRSAARTIGRPRGAGGLFDHCKSDSTVKFQHVMGSVPVGDACLCGG